MAKLGEIKEFLDKLIPLQMQDSWDNSGIQEGKLERDVKRVMFSLSITCRVIDEAVERKADLIVTHHPLTVSPIRKITDRTYPEKLILRLIESRIPVYALHTNLDVSELGPTYYMAEKLQLQDLERIQDVPGYGLIGSLPEVATQRQIFERLRSFLPEDAYRGINFKPEEAVRRVAICSGSGASLIGDVSGRADLYITGDVKFHDALKAIDLDLSVIDMGHFSTERLFYVKVKEALESNFPELDFITSSEKSPFEVLP